MFQIFFWYYVFVKRFICCCLFIALLFIGCAKKYNNSDDSETPKNKVVTVTEKQIEAIKMFQDFNTLNQGY